jgi:hypothetical protein
MSLKEEKFILAHGVKVSVHGCLVPLLWTCGEAEHHGGEHVVEEAVCLMVARKQRKREERAGVSVFKGSSGDITSSHMAPPLKGSATFHWCHWQLRLPYVAFGRHLRLKRQQDPWLFVR